MLAISGKDAEMPRKSAQRAMYQLLAWQLNGARQKKGVVTAIFCLIFRKRPDINVNFQLFLCITSPRLKVVARGKGYVEISGW